MQFFIYCLLDICQPLLSIVHRRVHNTETSITSALCIYSGFSVEASMQRHVRSVCLDVSEGERRSADNFLSHTLNTCATVVLVHK